MYAQKPHRELRSTPTIAITTICVGENPGVVHSCGSRKTGEGRGETEQKDGGMKTGSPTSDDDKDGKDGDGIWSVYSMPKDTPPSVLMRTPHQHHIIFVLTSPFAGKIFPADCMGPRAHEASIASPATNVSPRRRPHALQSKNPELVQRFGESTDPLEREHEPMASRRFMFVVSMQKYWKFNKEDIQICRSHTSSGCCLGRTVVNRSSTFTASLLLRQVDANRSSILTS